MHHYYMPTKILNAIAKRLRDPSLFVERILESVARSMVESLRANSPGERLPQEWEYTVDVSRTGGEMTVYHTRLEADRGTWEIIFHSHNSGSRDHFIAPVRATALSWVDGGTRFFSKGHTVSGVRARHFAEQAERELERAQDTIERAWAKWVETGKLP